jgi:hypothetical protein
LARTTWKRSAGVNILKLDAAGLGDLALGGVEEGEDAVAIDQVRILLDPCLQPDAVDLGEIEVRLLFVDQRRDRHFGAVLEIAGRFEPGGARQVEPAGLRRGSGRRGRRRGCDR